MIVEVLIVGLLAFGVGQTVALREGPLSIFEKWRDYWVERGGFEIYESPLGVHHNEKRPKSIIARMFACPYCIGAWSAGFAALLVATNLWNYILIAGAGIGVQVLLQNLADYFTDG